MRRARIDAGQGRRELGGAAFSASVKNPAAGLDLVVVLILVLGVTGDFEDEDDNEDEEDGEFGGFLHRLYHYSPRFRRNNACSLAGERIVIVRPVTATSF